MVQDVVGLGLGCGDDGLVANVNLLDAFHLEHSSAQCELHHDVHSHAVTNSGQDFSNKTSAYIKTLISADQLSSNQMFHSLKQKWKENRVNLQPIVFTYRADKHLNLNKILKLIPPSCFAEQPGSPSWMPCQRSSPNACRKHQTSQRCSSHWKEKKRKEKRKRKGVGVNSHQFTGCKKQRSCCSTFT